MRVKHILSYLITRIHATDIIGNFLYKLASLKVNNSQYNKFWSIEIYFYTSEPIILTIINLNNQDQKYALKILNQDR